MELDAKSKERLALGALGVAGDQGLTKNELAQAIWGSVTPSTQSMTTRLTQSLLDAGKITEEISGRRRIVRLRTTRKREPRRVPDDALSALHEGEWSRGSVKLEEGWERPFDRPYAQLERAARWVASRLNPKDQDDQEFAKVLFRVLTYSGEAAEDALEDRLAIDDISRNWTNTGRRDLARALGVFGISRERDFIAPDLLRGAPEWLQRKRPESLLWAAMALAGARRLYLAGGERAEGDVETLRSAAVSVLNKLAKAAPIHVAYWKEFSKALRGNFSSSEWSGLEAIRQNADVPTRSGSKLVQAIREDERALRHDAVFNDFFAGVERLIAVPFTSEVERRIGFSRRFRHDLGATPISAESWARDHAGIVLEVIQWFHSQHSDDPGLKKLTSKIDQLKRDAPKAARVTRNPTLDLVRYLGAPKRQLDGIKEQIAEQRTKRPLEYTELIRNNFWTPSMLWTDIALSQAT